MNEPPEILDSDSMSDPKPAQPESDDATQENAPSDATEKPADSPETIAPPRRHPKRFIAYRRRVVAAVALALPLVLLYGKPIPNTYRTIGVPMQIAGAMCLAAGLWIRFYATCWISGYKNRTLLQDGPYAHVRHPLYLGNTLAALGVGLISLSPWVLGIAALVLGPVFFATAMYEEGKLTEWFGDEYKAFMARTPRFFPRSWSFKFPSYAPMPWGVVREAFTALGYILAAALVTWLNWLKTIGSLKDSSVFTPIFQMFSG